MWVWTHSHWWGNGSVAIYTLHATTSQRRYTEPYCVLVSPWTMVIRVLNHHQRGNPLWQLLALLMYELVLCKGGADVLTGHFLSQVPEGMLILRITWNSQAPPKCNTLPLCPRREKLTFLSWWQVTESQQVWMKRQRRGPFSSSGIIQGNIAGQQHYRATTTRKRRPVGIRQND